MLTMLNLKDVLRALCTAILMCGLISSITIFANARDGRAFQPNSFDIEVTSAGMADLNVYSRGNEYTDLDMYYDYSVGATIRASLGRNTRASHLSLKVRLSGDDYGLSVSGDRDTGSYQISRSFELPRRDVSENFGRDVNLQAVSVFNHGNVAAFAINACQQNVLNYLRLNPGTTKDQIFAQDFTLLFRMDYVLKLYNPDPDFDWDHTPESWEMYRQLVRTGRHIICHKNSVGRQHRPPSDVFIIRKINIDFLPEVIHPDRCRLKARFQFETNKPSQEINFTIRYMHNDQYSPGTNPYARMVTESLGPYSLETDRNGKASGEIKIDVIDEPIANHKIKVGNLRVIGESNEFESKLLSYERDCQKPGAGSNMIKTLGTTPTQQIPSSALPKSAPIARPDAPDARFQQSNNRPVLKLQIPSSQFPGSAPIAKPDALDTRFQQSNNRSVLKLQKPTIGIKQPIFNNRPVLKPVVPSSRMPLPKKADAIKSTTPASSLKPMQPAASVPVLKPVLEKKKIPVLKPDLND